jgi:tRNA(Ile)-lysidine synthase
MTTPHRGAGHAAIPLDAALRDALARALGDVRAFAERPDTDPPRVVLAVSGGADSLALLHATARWAPASIATVATFDHGTGEAAREAVAFVQAESQRLGLPVVAGHDPRPARSEAGWRAARWAFLREVAATHEAVVLTGHTRDDQLETVVQRELRGAGARGLAGLEARGAGVRPWLGVSRAELREWLRRESLPWVEDPANADCRIQRVRLREDVLPVLESVSPGFADDMLAIGARAAAWRREAERFADTLGATWVRPGVRRIPRAVTAGWTDAMLLVVWPVWLAACDLVLTADGTRRLLRFILGEGDAGELELQGGGSVVRTSGYFEIRSPQQTARARAGRNRATVAAEAVGTLAWPGWRFTRLSAPPATPDDLWVAPFAAGTALDVRAWQPGDRIVTSLAGASRRVSRYLVEAGVPRLDRPAWPVVLADGEIAWAPGVCRGPAAPPRSGRSDLIWYQSVCEFG